MTDSRTQFDFGSNTQAHTPGPWEVSEQIATANAVAIIEFSPKRALTVVAPRLTLVPKGHYEGNARLIAAAPEMLEALERICAQAESWHKETGHEDDDPIIKCDGICACITQMKAAIGKAKGEDLSGQGTLFPSPEPAPDPPKEAA